MHKSQAFHWTLVAGFVVVGLLNLAFNPLVVDILRANQDCDDPAPTCSACEHAECDGNDWVCVPDTQPTCEECHHPECQNGAWVCVEDT
jgi:hypothetical protein